MKYKTWRKLQLLCICMVLLSYACKSTKEVVSTTKQNFRFAFYNVENLFDTKDHPEKLDDEFTPSGKKNWTADRYQKKLDNLSKVFTEMNYPSIIGLCEVENETVVRDLIEKTNLSKQNYELKHYESPDIRGIDVALIYKKEEFKAINSDIIRIDFPKEIVEEYTTRDILHVEGIFKNRDTIHFFVNHWPSRRGGLAESEPKRVYVAEQLKASINTIVNKNPQAKIVIMGDFNDETDNNSIVKTLNAKSYNKTTANNTLYNCSSTLDASGKGSYNYRGNWNMLDQFIVSSTLVNENSKLVVSETKLFQRDWLLFKHPRFGLKPNRTYGGPNYYGGYSDHLPVYVDVMMKQ